jgi:hypothetical protein
LSISYPHPIHHLVTCDKVVTAGTSVRNPPYHVDRLLKLPTCCNGLRCSRYLEAYNNRHPHILFSHSRKMWGCRLLYASRYLEQRRPLQHVGSLSSLSNNNRHPHILRECENLSLSGCDTQSWHGGNKKKRNTSISPRQASAFNPLYYNSRRLLGANVHPLGSDNKGCVYRMNMDKEGEKRKVRRHVLV